MTDDRFDPERLRYIQPPSINRNSVVTFSDEDVTRGREFALKMTNAHIKGNRFMAIHETRGATKAERKALIDYESLMAEWAAARFLGLTLKKRANCVSDGGIDFNYKGITGQVKHTHYRNGRLLFFWSGANGKFVADVAILATNGFTPNDIILRGWVTREMFAERRRDYFNPNNGDGADAVEQNQLEPMDTLREYLDERATSDGTVRA